jgi:hypothetical protein
MKYIIKEEGKDVGPTAALKVDSYHTARNGTRKTSMHSHLPTVNRKDG